MGLKDSNFGVETELVNVACQAWLERKRLRDSRLKAVALRKLASEAEQECSLAEEGGSRTNIVINPRDSHHHHHSLTTEQSKPARSSIVTFQIPHSDSDQKQKKDRFVLLSDQLTLIDISLIQPSYNQD